MENPNFFISIPMGHRINVNFKLLHENSWFFSVFVEFLGRYEPIPADIGLIVPILVGLGVIRYGESKFLHFNT